MILEVNMTYDRLEALFELQKHPSLGEAGLKIVEALKQALIQLDIEEAEETYKSLNLKNYVKEYNNIPKSIINYNPTAISGTAVPLWQGVNDNYQYSISAITNEEKQLLNNLFNETNEKGEMNESN